jgi:ApaG protein
MTSGSKSLGSVTLTDGVRVAVAPEYLPEQSSPELGQFVFGYRVRITNESARSVRLISRRWLIVDADGDRKEVEGEGVVGEQPELAPGESYMYSSFCPLETSWGTMEGQYIMRDGEGAEFAVRIGRFYLATGVDQPAADS